MMRLLEKSLLRKIAVYYSGLSFLILILVASSAYILARSSLKQSVINQLGLAVSLKENEINQWFLLQLQDVFLLSKLPESTQKIDALINLRQSIFVIEESDDYEYIKYYSEIKDILNKVTELKSNIKIASVVSNQGIVLISTNPLLEKTYQPLGHLTTYITDPKSPINPIFYNSIITQNKAITFVTPVYNQDNIKIAYISIELDLGEIDNFLHNSNDYEQDQKIYLVGRIGGQNTFVNSLTLQEKKLDFVDSFAIDTVLEGKNGSGLYINHQNIPVLGLYRWIEDKNMGLVAEITQKQAFSLAENLARQIFLIGCFLLIVILFIVYWISRKLVQPLTEISEAAIKVSQGNLNCHVPVLSKDELGTLAMSFNIMTEKLNHSFHELELMNQELQIKIDQLKTANQIAEKANQVKSEFISQMSHELRTPLNSILGFSQILDEDHEISDGKKHFVQGILASGYKLLELINNVISLCNQDQKEESLALSVVAVDDVLHEVIDRFRGQLKSLKLSLTYHLEPKVPQYIQTDVYGLTNILKHLVDNAVKFTPEGQITIKVNLLSDDNIDRLSAKMPSYLTFNSTPVDWLQWEIEDTGCGIKPEEWENLFQPFSRHVKTGGFQEGMGLGLPLCKKLVDQMGGEIQLESQVGIGTKVSIVLPSPKLDAEVELHLSQTRLSNTEPQSVSRVSGSIESWNTLKTGVESLSEVWLKKMHQACCEADDQKVMELLDELPESELAKQGMSELAQNYRLDKILELVEPLVIKN